MSIVVIAVVAVIVVVVLFSMSGANMFGTSSKTSQKITPQDYQTTYANNEHLLVDVRTAEEYNSGHIPGAINLALQDLPQKMDTLPKDQPIVVYCRSGARSNSAAQMLNEAGFDNIYDLGGIQRWQSQGLPVH